MQQAALNFDAPPLAQARAAGEVAMERATAAAERREPSFRERAEALILEKLRRGPASGEDVTDYVRAALPMKDGRALGSIYLSLAHRGLIEKAGSAPRRKGHGTSGAIVWRLTEAGRLLRDEQGRFAPVSAA
jgi:hypothetical protein